MVIYIVIQSKNYLDCVGTRNNIDFFQMINLMKKSSHQEYFLPRTGRENLMLIENVTSFMEFHASTKEVKTWR